MDADVKATLEAHQHLLDDALVLVKKDLISPIAAIDATVSIASSLVRILTSLSFDGPDLPKWLAVEIEELTKP